MRHGLFLLMVLQALPITAATLEIEDVKVTATTPTVQVVFDGPSLVSVRRLPDGPEFVQRPTEGQPLDVFYLHGDTFGVDKHQKTSVRRLSETAVLITVEGEDARRSLLVAVDLDSGDVLVTPDGLTHRRGVRSVGLRVALHAEDEAILPVINGLRVRQGQQRPSNGRFAWPFEWNAQLLVAQRDGHAMMIHSEDTTAQYKALQLHRLKDHTELVLETESPGPLWDNRTAGGVTWRINAYRGDWKVPAARYRSWMQLTYQLSEKRRHRPQWVDGVTLAFSWAAPAPAMLDAMAAVHPPEQTIIHLSDWRTDKYDVNYPEYTPREDVIKYIEKARQMGFHVAPHFNYFAVWYQHPSFGEMADFQLRSPDRNEPQGWHWPPETHDYTRMGYIHPGLGLWRSTLIEAVMGACSKCAVDFAFLDQTLCTWNTNNAHAQGRNTIEGMQLLLEQFNNLAPGLVVAGEGLNEMSFQRQAFAQAHIYDGWRGLEPWHPEVYVPICAFLWADHCRLIGYYHLGPGNPKAFELGVQVYENMGALPTLITNNPKDLQEPTALTKRVLDRAKRWQQVAATMASPD